MPTHSTPLYLPLELWERIFFYLFKYEILNLRMVNAMFRDVVPKHYLHRRVHALTAEHFFPFTPVSTRVWRASLAENIQTLSKSSTNQWYTALKVTPHVEYFGKRPRGFMDVTMSWFLDRTIFHEKTAKRLNETLCTRILPSMPNITTLVIIEGDFFMSQAIKELIEVPPRCAYIDIAWSQYSVNLTTLEIVIRQTNTWPSYCPAEDTFFPSLIRLRVRWDRTVSWPNVAAILASKSPCLEELGLCVMNDHPDKTSILPDDPKSLPRLRIFRWIMPQSYSRVPMCVLLFLKAFTLQLSSLSIRTWHNSLDEVALDISKLRSFCYTLVPGSGFIQTNILEQLETPGLCSFLTKLVLRFAHWPASQVQSLLGALANLSGSLKELTLFLPLYCTDWLIRIAQSTPRLESLCLVIAEGWRTDVQSASARTIPYSIFADEVLSLGPRSLELRAWKLLDLTIRPQFRSIHTPELNIQLMRAVSSVVPSIYSFYGLGHMRFEPMDEHLLPITENAPKDGYIFGWIGEDL